MLSLLLIKVKIWKLNSDMEKLHHTDVILLLWDGGVILQGLWFPPKHTLRRYNRSPRALRFYTVSLLFFFPCITLHVKNKLNTKNCSIKLPHLWKRLFFLSPCMQNRKIFKNSIIKYMIVIAIAFLVSFKLMNVFSFQNYKRRSIISKIIYIFKCVYVICKY